MGITTFGYLFLIICFYLLFRPTKYLIAVVIFSCIFQATSVVNISEKGVPPYIIGSLFLILKTFFTQSLTKYNKNPFINRIFFFSLFAVCTSFIFPFLWEGITVYYESNVDKMFFERGGPLYFGMKNIIQAAYIVINFLTIYCIYKNSSQIPANFIFRVFIIAVITVVVIGLWEFIAKTIGIIPFPSSFFYSNEGYGQDGQAFLQTMDGAMRLKATFNEPSYCGAFLAATFGAIIAQINGTKSTLLLLFVSIALVLNLSGTGIVSLGLGGSVIMLLNFNKFKKVLVPIFIIILLAVILSWFIDFGIISNMLGNKSGSQSGEVRVGASYFTWSLFLETFGIGVGLGSHRGSSFVLDLLASLGVIGTILFFRTYFYLLKRTFNNQNNWLFNFTVVLLVAQLIAIPDMSFSIMWMGLFMFAAISQASFNKQIQNN